MNKWSRDELVLALLLYCETPFGRIHQRNPDIIHLAQCLGRTPSAVAMKMSNFASFDPTISRAGLGNGSKADKDIWNDLINNWDGVFEYGIEVGVRIGYRIKNAIGDEILSEIPEGENTVGQNKKYFVNLRIGQKFFRNSVLSNYNNSCCISGVNNNKLLIASHIVPWSVRREARLNPSNGLCLSVLHDRAFDAGLISINSNLCLILSNDLKKGMSEFIDFNFTRFEGDRIKMPEKFAPSLEYLDYHRNHIFLS